MFLKKKIKTLFWFEKRAWSVPRSAFLTPHSSPPYRVYTYKKKKTSAFTTMRHFVMSSQHNTPSCPWDSKVGVLEEPQGRVRDKARESEIANILGEDVDVANWMNKWLRGSWRDCSCRDLCFLATGKERSRVFSSVYQGSNRKVQRTWTGTYTTFTNFLCWEGIGTRTGKFLCLQKTTSQIYMTSQPSFKNLTFNPKSSYLVAYFRLLPTGEVAKFAALATYITSNMQVTC